MERKALKTILVIDDDPHVRDILKGALEREYTVVDASNYAETKRLIRHPFDLAIIDYILPDSDGFDVLKALREAYPALPAIIMTGYSNEDVVIKAIRYTVADYIKKPLSLGYLRMRIAEIFGQGKVGEYVEEGVNRRDDFIFDGIATHIRENYMKDLTLDKLSRMACMSRFRFCRGFKKRFGLSFISFINDIRVNKAAALLKNPALRIRDIAHSVGYGSFSQFERIFKRLHGISPREFRSRIKHLT